MISLPIDSHLPQITDTLRTHNALVITAAPGAGKTTRVPPALIAANLLPKNAPNLIMLQPRRVAARAAAERIAHENHWQLGHDVGYHIRFEKRYTEKTRIRILTEAILTRILLSDPYLDTIGAVILDEFHERNLHTDLALAFLRELQQTVRPDLKIIVMSATLDAAPIAQYLNHAPIIEVPGRTFPIEITYRPARDIPLETQVATVLDEALTNEGDILIFLPGLAEIERTHAAIKNQKSKIKNELILPLHGSLSSEEQQRALQPDPQHRRKIILATNIAETSLTIDGIRTVIDTGLARIASFDPDRGMDRLDLQRISKASATQRAGRAGRQAPGHAFRLWSQQEQNRLEDFNAPEIQRIDLAPTILAIHAWGHHNPITFPWFEPPQQDRLTAAENLLELLGALKNGALSETGQHMLRLPTHPRIAKLLLTAAHTPLQSEALTLATQLSSDSRTQTDNRIHTQLANILNSLPPIQNQKSKIKNLNDLLLIAYPDHVARRRAASDPTANPLAAIMVGNLGLRLTPDLLAQNPALAQTDLLIATEIHHDPRNRRAEAAVRAAIPIDLATLERLLPEFLHETRALEYDPAKEKVLALHRRYYRDLLLAEDPHAQVDPQLAGPILAAALAPQAAEIFNADEPSARLLARLALVRRHAPEYPWPTLDTAQLQQRLHDAAHNKRTRAELTANNNLLTTLKSTLLYPLDRQLETLAPESLPVPSGSNIRLDYANDPPILAVRLQELFGLTATPRLCNNRIAVLLHLLSPGYKPIQITSDLASFWKSAYFEVRKDLRARYPKHKWPDNPLTAPPEAKGRRR